MTTKLRRSERTPQWRQLCRNIVEVIAVPAMILDAETRQVVLLNTPMEKLIGWSSAEADGRTWDELCPILERSDASSLTEASALGAVKVRSTFVNRLGHHVEVQAHLITLAAPQQHMLVVRILESKILPGETIEGSFEYCISTAPSDWGRLISLRSFRDDQAHAELVGRRCFQVIANRKSPCPGCPAQRRPPGSGELTAALPDHRGDGTALVTAFRSSDNQQRLLHKQITEQMFAQLLEARLLAITSTGGLSDREREVFLLLVKGRSPSEIALMLGVETSTAKYHVSKILRKLGAESRIDLMRVLF
jgi:DNA-binding CsgD family transcriptional regulator